MASSKKKRSTKSKKTTAKAVEPAVDKKQDAKVSKTEPVRAKTTKTTPKKEAVAKVLAEKPRFNAFAWNKWLAITFALQGIAILVVSATKTLPVTMSYLTPGPLGEGGMFNATHHIFDLDVAWLIAISLLSLAVVHTLLATAYRQRYEAELTAGVNRMRWAGYGVGGSVMAVAVALLGGISDLASLLMIVTLTLMVSLLGFMQERKQGGRVAYILCTLAGVVTWTVLGMYLIGANIFGSGTMPAFLYWVYGSALVFYGAFAANFYLLRKQQGKWSDYLYGERMYMILGFVTATAIAWQIFAGTLRP